MLRLTVSLSSTIIFDDCELPLVGASSTVKPTSSTPSVDLLSSSFSYSMAPFSIQSQNKPRSIGSSLASISPMSPEIIALICSSVLIFLLFLSSATVLIHRRLRRCTQNTTQVEAQVQVPAPAAKESKEQVEDVFSPASSSLKSLAVEPLLPPIATLRPTSTATAEDFVEKLMSKTSAALSKADKYTTLPLRRSRLARRSRIGQKNPVFDLSMSLAALDAAIVNSETSRVPARRLSHQSSSMRSVSLMNGSIASSSTFSRSEIQTYAVPAPSNASDLSAIRPSPTIVSMEARPLETDAAALPDAGTMFVSGSIPSFSSISSAISLRSICQPASPECKTPRRREERPLAENNRTSGTPSSSSSSTSISISTVLTVHDTTFSSDASTVSEGGSREGPVKALKLGDVLSLPASMFNLSFGLSGGKGDDAIGLRPSSGSAA